MIVCGQDRVWEAGDTAALGAKARRSRRVHRRRKAFRQWLAARRSTRRQVALELIFGELVTNAVRYGDDPMSVVVAVDDGCLLICVDNAGDCFDLVSRLMAEPTTTGGRGLQIVRALADTMTVERVERLPEPACRVTVTAPL